MVVLLAPNNGRRPAKLVKENHKDQGEKDMCVKKIDTISSLIKQVT
jgi:hypothetical protein